MNSIINLSAQQLRRAADIKDKIQFLQNELSQILVLQLNLLPLRLRRKGAKMSASGRAKIAAAQELGGES